MEAKEGKEEIHEKITNVNIGILGHIDSGKTSLAKALSTLQSTAAFDKSPQSKGITRDLGFSAFIVPKPSFIDIPFDKIQFTLVDCPGHASLIRTIIGGASIIDMMLLVIDVTKGIQTQTAEGLVIGEILANKMVVVLNKVDLVPPEKKVAHMEKLRKGLLKVLENTKFANSPMVEVSANPNAGNNIESKENQAPVGISNLIDALLHHLNNPKRDSSGPFVFSIDHCFAIKGQGTVMTGTILSGSVKVNQNIEIPRLKMQKKVKSMQMFHRPVNEAHQGDRVGICVTQLDAKLIERGLACDPDAAPTITGAIVAVRKIRFFKSQCQTKVKLHITIGHSTVMATCTFFGLPDAKELAADKSKCIDKFSELPVLEKFDFDKEYLHQNELYPASEEHPIGSQYVLLEFESEVTCPLNSIVIGSKLDSDIHSNSCRIAFYGRLLSSINPTDEQELKKLKIYKPKQKEGVIDRIVDQYNLIGKGLFAKETDMNLFVGMKVLLQPSGIIGTIESSFGKTGKFKVYFPDGHKVNDTSGKLILHFKRFNYKKEKKMLQ